MIIIKLKIAAVICFALVFSFTASADDTLTITHIAKTPDGEQYEIAVEVIKNINDLYYYSAEQSPVASKLLKSGYTLLNEKNKIIEADVVSNGGEIKLEYSPTPQKVMVTYYKKDGDDVTKIGTIEDKAYVGQRYTPVLPMGETDTEIALSEESHVIKYGDNNFSVTYEDDADSKSAVSSHNRLINGNGALMSNFDIYNDKGYIYGYGDGTFKPDKNITKGELFNMLSGVTNSNKRVTRSGHSSLLNDGILDKEDLADVSALVTWDDFNKYAKRLDEKLSRKKLVIPDRRNETALLTRADAVAAINSLIEKKDSNLYIFENKFSDVYEDHWAYFEILKATAE